MNIFLSFSGAISQDVAGKLRTWLRSVIQATDPWMSKEDIAPGAIRFGSISESITKARYGIICVTRENKRAPWLLWEAGALYRGFAEEQAPQGDDTNISQSRVVPFLINLSKDEVDQPLSNFQVIDGRDKNDVLRLLRGINSELPSPLPDELIENQLDLYWSSLQEIIEEAIETHPSAVEVESTCKYTFSDAADKFLKVSGKQAASIRRDEIALSVPRLYIDSLPLDQVNDEALRKYKEDRLAGTIPTLIKGKPPKAAAPSTLNKELRTIGAVLNRAAQEWGWIEYAPTIKKVPQKGTRRPYVLSWEEQEKLFLHLPPHIMEAALFSVNTGVRKGLISDLEWRWLRHIPSINAPIFIVPPGYHGSKYGRPIFLNSIAQRIVERRRNLHPKSLLSHIFHENLSRAWMGLSGGSGGSPLNS